MNQEQTNIAPLLRSRRTIHNFTPELPDESVILDAIESARWAPNHRVTEPWQFYLVGPETAARISQLNYELVLAKRGEAAAQNKLQRWLAIPGWFVVTCDRIDEPIRSREDFAACCCAVQNLALHLWSLGIGTKWGSGPVTREPRVYDILDIDIDSEEIVGIFWYGYPAVIPAGQRIRTVDDIVTKRP